MQTQTQKIHIERHDMDTQNQQPTEGNTNQKINKALLQAQKEQRNTKQKHNYDKKQQQQQWQKRRYQKRITFEEGGKRPQVLNMDQGNRTLSIVSINPDNLTTTESKLTVTHLLRKNKIHIAAIQETHIPHDQNYKLNGYRIITTKALINTGNKQGMAEGGVAILIHEDLEQHITHIHRINHRIMKITMHSEESHTPVTIINTYAPHQGKTKTEQQEHWKMVQQTLKTTPRKHLTIWCADANGQIGKITQEEEKPRRIFGPYVKQEKAEKGNGRAISYICYQENMIPMNTWKKAPLTKEEKETIKNKKTLNSTKT